ncbi:MAG: cytochrome c maturation protein CcmE [Planctomycetes bacterium]|nr:cytochrome c maturation protein CcmE [Planctomycetota bacterium]
MNTKIIIVVLLFAAAVGSAVLFAMTQGGTEYRTFPEMQAATYKGERVKVKAQVVAIESEHKPTVFTANDIVPVTEEERRAHAGRALGASRVIYEGDDVPQGFKQACHVTLEGRYDAKRQAFIATTMTTQCPSRYEGQGVPPPPAKAPAPEKATP